MQTPSARIAAVALGTLFALSACHVRPTNVVAADDDPQAAQLKAAKPVAPPPMIQATRAYRCDDNSLINADFYTNNTVSVRTKDGATHILTATGGKPPYTGSGYSISANATHISFTAPGKGSQGCDT